MRISTVDALTFERMAKMHEPEQQTSPARIAPARRAAR